MHATLCVPLLPSLGFGLELFIMITCLHSYSLLKSQDEGRKEGRRKGRRWYNGSSNWVLVNSHHLLDDQVQPVKERQRVCRTSLSLVVQNAVAPTLTGHYRTRCVRSFVSSMHQPYGRARAHTHTQRTATRNGFDYGKGRGTRHAGALLWQLPVEQ